ncbi:MAG: hypothetical protein QGG69_03705 [Kiritimatiellia bacterium]|jgi:hypothetical protein|nr:hypothetical protein [Kiritimatiellia bacterium]
MLFALSILSLSAQPVPAQAVDLSRLYALKPYRTPSRRFVILGPETLDNMKAGRWAEAMTDRVESILSESLPFDRREIRIVIRPPTSVSTGTVTEAECGPLALTRKLEAGRLVQRMVVPRVDCLAADPVRMAFCRFLLEGFVTPVRMGAAAPEVPRWLIVGVMRNLGREQRQTDAFAMVREWREGRVPPLADWLKRADLEWNEATDGPISALLLAWLVEASKGKDRMRRLSDHIAAETMLQADWLAAELVAEGASISDLEMGWDAWIMRQQRKVFLPGSTPPVVLRQLSGELLLYPGAFGIPLSSGIERGAGFDALIRQRKADWIDAFCLAKQVSLRALAVGRGAMVQGTVERYTAFLDALVRGKRTSRLERLLSEAEAARHELAAAMKRPGPGALDEANHDSTDTENTGRQSR